MARPCAGNDVLDLSPALRADRAPEAELDFRQRHLTTRERASGAPFWTLFAAKEAAAKALAQAGVEVPRAAFRDLETDLSAHCVTHVPSGARAHLTLIQADAQKVHCVAVFGDAGTAPLSAVREVPAGGDPGEEAREALIDLLAMAAPGPGGRARFAVGSRGGVPAVLESGSWRDWSVSLSHSGRFAAASLLLC